jgi:hypothetical protein
VNREEDLRGTAGFIISGMPGRKPAYLTYPNQVDPSGSTKNDFQILKIRESLIGGIKTPAP